MRYSKTLIKPPVFFVLLSFLFGLLNFVDTFLRLFFFYMLHAPYLPGIGLKPLFFVLQAFCLTGFLFEMTSHKIRSSKPKFRGLMNLHFAILVTTIVLFFVNVTIDPGKHGIIFYTDSIWIICYVVGLSVTCFWFFSKLLRENRFRMFSIVFLFAGLAFFTKILYEIYLWPQRLFGYPLPPAIEDVTMFSPAVFMGLAALYSWVYLSTRQNVVPSRVSVFELSAVILAVLLPSIWNSYKNGLINWIINDTTYFGLEYIGYSWYSVSLYLASFVAYIFLFIHLAKNLDQTVASYLILLGVVSFPWSGLMILNLSYSSILGNMLSLDALIVGFYLRKHHMLIRY